MSTTCKKIVRTNRRTFAAAEQTCCGEAATTGFVAVNVLNDATIQPADDNLTVETASGEFGVENNISSMSRYEMTDPVRLNGTGTQGVEPEAGILLKGSTHVRVVTTVLEVNETAVSSFELGENLTNSTQANSLGVVANIVDLNYLPGTLTVNGAFTAVTTISAANTDKGTLVVGSTFLIDGDVTSYEVTVVTNWTDCAGSNQDITFTPSLVTPTTGAEAITVTGLSRIFLLNVDNAPVATDAIVGDTSTATATIKTLTNEQAQLYYPVDSPITYLTIRDNTDDLLREAYDVVGTSVLDFVNNDFPKLTFTSQGRYLPIADSALVAATSCSTKIKAFQDARMIYDGRDLRDLSMTEFHLDTAIDVQQIPTALNNTGVYGFFNANALPTATFNVASTTVADFNLNSYRDPNVNGNVPIVPVTLEHNINGLIDERIDIVIPSSQMNSYPSINNDSGRETYTANLSVNRTCSSGLPRYMIYFW